LNPPSIYFTYKIEAIFGSSANRSNEFRPLQIVMQR